MLTDDAIGAYNRLVDSLTEESDRAAAILGASLLDAMLGEVLASYLVEDKLVEELFRGDRPLATFAARISLLFALGLLPANLHSEFTRVRRVRNHFAHHPLATTFDDPPVSDWCRELIAVYPTHPDQVAQMAAWAPRTRYQMTLLSLAGYLGMLRASINSGLHERRKVPRSHEGSQFGALLPGAPDGAR